MSLLAEFEDLVLGPQRVDGTNLRELFLNLHIDLQQVIIEHLFRGDDGWDYLPWMVRDQWARDTLGDLRLLIYSLHRHWASCSLQSNQTGSLMPTLEWSWRLEWDLAYLLVSSYGQAYVGWLLYNFSSTILRNQIWLVMFHPRNPFVPNQPFQPHFELHVVILFGLKINHQQCIVSLFGAKHLGEVLRFPHPLLLPILDYRETWDVRILVLV